MPTETVQPEIANPKTGITHPEMKAFVSNHFEAFVNRRNLEIADVNFAPEFVDHGADEPAGTPPRPWGAKPHVGGACKKFPDLHVTSEDMIAEDDRIVVRNTWRGTDVDSGTRLQFGGIVIWRIAHRQLGIASK
jgi:hypothetical protein